MHIVRSAWLALTMFLSILSTTKDSSELLREGPRPIIRPPFLNEGLPVLGSRISWVLTAYSFAPLSAIVARRYPQPRLGRACCLEFKLIVKFHITLSLGISVYIQPKLITLVPDLFMTYSIIPKGWAVEGKWQQLAHLPFSTSILLADVLLAPSIE